MSRDEYLRALIDSAPPLSDRQRERLAALLPSPDERTAPRPVERREAAA